MLCNISVTTLNKKKKFFNTLMDNGSVKGAPHLKQEHLPVFACSMGDHIIEPLGHVRMMAAVQPFLSGAISKTANLSQNATVEEIEQLYMEAWKLGVKALAVYRDNCKIAQPLSVNNSESEDPLAHAAESLLSSMAKPQRERLPRLRSSKTFEFRVADCKGFVTVGEYDDGRPGEIFIRVSKQGSTLAGIMDGLQWQSVTAFNTEFRWMRMSEHLLGCGLNQRV